MNKNVVNVLLGSVFCLFSVQKSVGQTVSSPYTFGSLGLLSNQSFVHQQFMGGLASSLYEKGDYSLINPASFHGLEQTSLQTGSEIRFIEQTTADKRNTNFNGNFGYFSMGIPISLKRKIALGVELNKLTEVEYILPGEGVENGVNVTNQFAGRGGIGQFKAGIGGEVFKDFSLGVGATFLFGNIEERLDKQFPQNNEIFSLRRTAITYYNGVKWNFGVQYTGHISDKTEWTFGAHMSPATDMSTGTDEVLRTYNYNGNFFIDTVSNRKDAVGNQGLPLEYGGGLSIGQRDKWLIGVEYGLSQWSDVAQLKNANPFYDQQSFTIGGYLQLKDKMDNQHSSFGQTTSDYLKTTRIYYGFRMESLYTGVVSSQINQMAVSLGFGLPIVRTYSIEGQKFRMVSRINIGAEYLIRGETSNGLVQENILGIKVGLNFNDKWFNKRKYQ